MRGIILEGISASGKSSILTLIQQRILQEYPSSTKLFISEHYTQRMLEHKLESQSLASDDVKDHVDKIISNLSTYQDMLDQSKFAGRLSGADAFVTIERFLLTFLATQGVITADYPEESAKKQLSQLSELNIRQYLLVLSENTLRDHIARTLTHRNDQWAHYVESKGGIDKLTSESLEWQNNFLSQAKRFNDIIRTETVEVEGWNYEEIANRIFENEFGESKQ